MHKHLTALFFVFATAAPGYCATVEERIFSALQAQGYTVVEHGYTFLGRLRVVVESDKLHRELVFNPGTGEVLRDYSVLLSIYLDTQSDDSTSSSKPTTTMSAASAAGDMVGITAQEATTAEPEGAPLIIPEPIVP